MDDIYSGEPELPTGAELLDDVETFLARFVAYPSEHARIAHVLWIAHAHLMDCWESTPRIAFLSPEPGSGKSRCLEVTEPLVPRPVHAVNTTPAYLFRKVSERLGRPPSSTTRSTPCSVPRPRTTRTSAGCSTPDTAREPWPDAAWSAARSWRPRSYTPTARSPWPVSTTSRTPS